MWHGLEAEHTAAGELGGVVVAAELAFAADMELAVAVHAGTHFAPFAEEVLLGLLGPGTEVVAVVGSAGSEVDYVAVVAVIDTETSPVSAVEVEFPLAFVVALISPLRCH